MGTSKEIPFWGGVDCFGSITRHAMTGRWSWIPDLVRNDRRLELVLLWGGEMGDGGGEHVCEVAFHNFFEIVPGFV